MLHVRRTKSQPLHPEKNSSKSLSLTRSIFTAMLNVPLFFFFLNLSFLTSISKETISDSDEEME